MTLAALWAAGFGWFLYLATRDAPFPPRVDGIAALTGGPDRVEVALRLLAAGAAGRLLISGTGGNADLATLAHRAGVDPAPLADRITLGRAAHSTRGNALETRAWAREYGIHDILVVTAWFHMPRALAELRGAMPDTRFHACPVGRLALEDFSYGGVMRRVIGEYHKYLGALAGVSGLPFSRGGQGPAGRNPGARHPGAMRFGVMDPGSMDMKRRG